MGFMKGWNATLSKWMGVQLDDDNNLKVNPGSPACGAVTKIADALTEGTYYVALNGTGLQGYYVHYVTLVATTTMDFQFRADTSLGYLNIATQLSCTASAGAAKIVTPSSFTTTLIPNSPLPADMQVKIVVGAGGTCNAWLIPIPA